MNSRCEPGPLWHGLDVAQADSRSDAEAPSV